MTASGHILLVEDSAAQRELYRSQLTGEGFAVTCAGDIKAAREHYHADAFDLVLLDLGLPDGDGLDLLRTWRGDNGQASASIVVITANASIASAVKAVREGAWDYLIKPVTRDRLITTVRNALERRTLKHIADSAAGHVAGKRFARFIGSSRAMQAVYDKIASIAGSRAPVFITGESGTGKELCAQAVHGLSARRDGPFIAINCGAIPRDLMESEIFGHVKGAFTGAIETRQGAAGAAHGGTLFLDEVCELDPALQTKLLRFLQSGKVHPVGAATPTQVDVRIVCATNKSPTAEVAAGRFREDLYFRLHVLPIHLPPLSARGRDVIEIAADLLARFAAEEGRAFRSLSPETEAVLMRHSWPGNVRELENAIRQAVVLYDGEVLEPDMLRDAISLPGRRPTTAAAGEPNLDVTGLAEAALDRSPPGARLELWQIEKQAIEAAIARCGGSVPQAARELGVSPSTIYRKRDGWLRQVHTRPKSSSMRTMSSSPR